LPLLFACSAGNKEIVEFMIKNGANFGYVDENGRNALTIAYKKEHKSICEILISNGANFDCKDGFRLLLDNCKKLEDVNDLEFLLKNGAPQNGYDCDRMCPLLVASENGFIDKVRLLLINSLECLNKKNKMGLSSLHFASINNHLEVARLLIDNGADVNSEDINKETPLMLACKMNHKATIELLINKGADVNRRNRNVETALVLSLECSNIDDISTNKRIEFLEIAFLLIEKDTDLNLVYRNGHDALMIAINAIKSHSKEIVEDDLLVLIIKIIMNTVKVFGVLSIS